MIAATHERIAPPGFVPRMPRQHRRRASLASLGACPSYAPYETEGGGCSNIEPGVDAFQYFNAGGTASDGVVSSQDVYSFAEESAPTAQTGLTFADPQLNALNTAARFGLQLTPDKETQDRLVAEFIRQAEQLGYTADCAVVMNSAPGAQSMYTSQCSLDGGEQSISPALTLRPGGWSITLVEEQQKAGNTLIGQPAPVIYDNAVYWPTTDQPYPTQTNAETTALPTPPPPPPPTPTITYAPPPTATPTTTTQPQPTYVVVQQPASTSTPRRTSETIGSPLIPPAIKNAVNSVMPEALQKEWAGVPQWAWAAAALAGYYFFIAKKGGRR